MTANSVANVEKRMNRKNPYFRLSGENEIVVGKELLQRRIMSYYSYIQPSVFERHLLFLDILSLPLSLLTGKLGLKEREP